MDDNILYAKGNTYHSRPFKLEKISETKTLIKAKCKDGDEYRFRKDNNQEYGYSKSMWMSGRQLIPFEQYKREINEQLDDIDEVEGDDEK